MNEKIINKIISIGEEIFDELGSREGMVQVSDELLLKAVYHNLLICCTLDEAKTGLYKSRYEKFKETGKSGEPFKSGDEIPLAVIFMKANLLCTDLDLLFGSGVKLGFMNLYKRSGILTGLVA